MSTDEFTKVILRKAREYFSPSDWCNDWGRKMGISGDNKNSSREGVDDDLDAFRHAFFSAIIVAWNPLDIGQIDKEMANFLGRKLEDTYTGDKCAREMDLYNNQIGRNLAPNSFQMLSWLAKFIDPHQKIAEIIADAVKSGKTVNNLSDSRIEHCKVNKTGAFIWRSKGDSNVRTEHAMRDGKVFRWEDLPENEWPGNPHGCRCTAEPVVSEEAGQPLEKMFKGR